MSIICQYNKPVWPSDFFFLPHLILTINNETITHIKKTVPKTIPNIRPRSAEKKNSFAKFIIYGPCTVNTITKKICPYELLL